MWRLLPFTQAMYSGSRKFDLPVGPTIHSAKLFEITFSMLVLHFAWSKMNFKLHDVFGPDIEASLKNSSSHFSQMLYTSSCIFRKLNPYRSQMLLAFQLDWILLDSIYCIGSDLRQRPEEVIEDLSAIYNTLHNHPYNLQIIRYKNKVGNRSLP